MRGDRKVYITRKQNRYVMSAPSYSLIDADVADQMYYTLSRIHADRRAKYVFWWIWFVRVFVIAGIWGVGYLCYSWKQQSIAQDSDNNEKRQGLEDETGHVPMLQLFGGSSSEKSAVPWKKKRDWTPVHVATI